MKKSLPILMAALLAFVGVNAQQLESVDANFKWTPKTVSLDKGTAVRTANCGNDTLFYASYKATNLRGLSVNNTTSATEISQYFDAPSLVTITGVSFYAWASTSPTPLPNVPVTVSIYNAGPDSLPAGAALASVTVNVDSAFGNGNLENDLKQVANFTNPVTTNQPFLVAVSNNSPNNIVVVHSDWTLGDGGQEWLLNALIGTNYLRGYQLSIGGGQADADAFFEPHINYSFSSNYVLNDPSNCLPAGKELTFLHASDGVSQNRFYNLAAFLGLPEASITWKYGDGTVENAGTIDGVHTYTSGAAQYSVTLIDSIFMNSGEVCVDSISNTFDVGPTSKFGVEVNGQDVTFSDSSELASSYSWDFGDGNTSTMASPTHTYASSGMFTVTQIVTNSCSSDTSTAMVDIVASSIQDDLLASQIRSFPNPNNGQFQVELSMDEVRKVEITLLNVVGQVIEVRDMGAVQQQTVRFNRNLEPGIYLLQVKADDAVATRRIVVE